MSANRKVSDETAQQIVEDWGVKTPEELAQEHGISRATVYVARKRWLAANGSVDAQPEIHIHVHVHIDLKAEA